MLTEPRSRRDFLTAMAKTMLSASGTAALSGVSAFATSLNGVTMPSSAERLIPYGAAARSDALAGDPAYRAAIIANCEMVAPENELKWSELRPTRDQYRFEKADAVIAFARQNRMAIRGQALSASAGLPAWTDALGNRACAERELVDHIQAVVGRYRGQVSSWDVVSEPLADWPEDEQSFRPSIFAQWLRADYLPIALQAAAAADPEARLVLNEYDLEFRGPRFTARRNALIGLLRSLRDRDVPLHAVGLQAHLFADRSIDRDGLQRLLAEIVRLKLDVIVTELDVIDYELPGQVSERDARVATIAEGFLQPVCEVVRPKAILTWGLSDRYSWVPTYFKRPDGMPNRPLPLDADLRRKPLFDVIDEYRRKSA
jgi:endo-1,4-beta-xylanase